MKAIEAACNVSKLEGYDKDAYSENITLCRDMMNDAIANSKNCQKLTESVTDQCKCWQNQSILVGRIKQFNCLAKATQKLVTAHKNECIKVFGVCKKKEDATVEAVYSCMNDRSMGFINQTLDTLGKDMLKFPFKYFCSNQSFQPLLPWKGQRTIVLETSICYPFELNIRK